MNKPGKKNTKKKKKGEMIRLPEMRSHAAGIDIGAEEIFVAVPPTADDEPVRKFATSPRICGRSRNGW